MNAIAVIAPGMTLPSPANFERLKDLLSGAMHLVSHPNPVRQGVADFIVDQLDGGVGAGNMVFQTAAAAEVATCALSNPAAGNANATGVATFNAISDDTNATGGTTDRGVLEDGDGVDIINFSVGTAGEDVNLSSVVIGVGDTVQITALDYTAMP